LPVQASFPAVLNIGSFSYANPYYHTEGYIPDRVDSINVKKAVQLCLAALVHVDIYGTWLKGALRVC
jgi:hypothetical protein